VTVEYKHCTKCGKRQGIATRLSICKTCRESDARPIKKYPLVTIAGFVYQVIPDENWVDGCWNFDADPKIRHIKRSWVPQECLMGDEA
jgi:hypothetical protein